MRSASPTKPALWRVRLRASFCSRIRRNAGGTSFANNFRIVRTRVVTSESVLHRIPLVSPISSSMKGGPVAISIASPSTTTRPNTERSLELALAAARTAADDRATDLVVLDLRELTSEFDYFVLA